MVAVWAEPHAGEARTFALRPLRVLWSERLETVTLPIAWHRRVEMQAIGVGLYEAVVEQHLAFKSEETPLATLRRIPGFVEAPGLT